MARLQVSQLRSGEGALLASCSSLSVAELAAVLPDLLAERWLLIAGEELPPEGPPGARRLAEGLFGLEGEAALAFLRELKRWARRSLILAVRDAAPPEDVRERCIPDPLRPWDHERLKAHCYAQLGRRFAHQGVWFVRETDRGRWFREAVGRVVEAGGCSLPSGDLGLVLELPPDQPFEASFSSHGRGDAFRLRREFPERGYRREWWIERGEWKGEEERRPKARRGRLLNRSVQWLASAAIFLVSVPVTLFVLVVLVSTKLTDVSSTARKAPSGR